ncbi:unnamed protein product, partial [Oppiella nova]
MKQKLGVNAFSLAFALGGVDGCHPKWDGEIPIDDPAIVQELKAFREAGGQLIVSTGGAAGLYLENACRTTDELLKAYRQVVDMTGAVGLDIDVETSLPLDVVMPALAAIQKEKPGLTVNDDDYGLNDPLGVDVITSAVKHGVDVDVVNAMTMNFESSHRKWGAAVIAAGEATIKQMAKIWPQKSEQELYSMLGSTPMIGLNDNGMVFTQEHAHQLLTWAKQKHLGHIGFWSINRDKQCEVGQSSLETDGCSDIKQQMYEFTKIFVQFNNNSVGINELKDTYRDK